jgi:hypothetical protein
MRITRLTMLVVLLVWWVSNAQLYAQPVSPSNMQIHYLPGQLHLTWQDNSSDEYYFTIERKITPIPGTWQELATVNANHTSYQMDNPVTGSTYYFRVKACGEFGCSAWSNEPSIYCGTLIYSMKINVPDGGEALPAGGVYPISWGNYNSPPANVNLDYSLDAGSHWTSIKADYPNTGLYYWKIPDKVSGEGLVRVSSSSNSNVYDLTNHVFEMLGYDFDGHWGTATQGWSVSGVYDEDDYPIDTDFRFNWRDLVEYPQQPGFDPAGNGEGTMAIVKNAAGIIDANYLNPNASFWYQELISPDLEGVDYWQHALGFRVRVAHCMQTNAQLYCNLIVRVLDTDLNMYRTFTYPAEATPLTYCQYGVGNTWNSRSFLWSNIPDFPANFTLSRIYVRIWGDLYYMYQAGNNGSVFIDDIMPIWPFWDFNADGMTNIVDFTALSSAWLTDTSDPTWNPVFDHNPVNYQIDIYDLNDFINNWLSTW